MRVQALDFIHQINHDGNGFKIGFKVALQPPPAPRRSRLANFPAYPEFRDHEDVTCARVVNLRVSSFLQYRQESEPGPPPQALLPKGQPAGSDTNHDRPDDKADGEQTLFPGTSRLLHHGPSQAIPDH